MDIASLIYDVSKDLYAYYQKAKGRDDDLKDIRAQLLWMSEKSVLIQEVLQRNGTKAEDKSNIKQNLRKCKDAVAELQSATAKLKTVGQDRRKTFAKMKSRLEALGLKTAWPLKKETIAALAGYARTCHSSLDSAVSLLHLNISLSQIEKIQDLDRAIMDGDTSMDATLQDMKTVFQRHLAEISMRLMQQSEELAQQTELLKRERDEEQAQKIVESLKFDGMNNRMQQIMDAKDETYSWLFTPEAESVAEAQQLVQFLNTGSGLFWIQQVDTHEIPCESPAWGHHTVAMGRRQRSHNCVSFLLDRGFAYTEDSVGSITNFAAPCSPSRSRHRFRSTTVRMEYRSWK
jgi:hypothetical protein